MREAQPIDAETGQRRRAFWLKTLHQWHWISAALSLLCMLAFAGTGITLNHAAQIGAKPQVTHWKGTLPAPLLESVRAHPSHGTVTLAPELAKWLQAQLQVSVEGRDAEWSDTDIYVALPRPGGDAWLSVALGDGAVEYEKTDRGWIAYFNDLHKGRNTGPLWNWFIDVFAGACLLFCITGLFLLQLHAGNRGATWPLVGLGLLVPLLLMLLFIH